MCILPALQEGPGGKNKQRFVYEADLALVKQQSISNVACDEKAFFPNIEEETIVVDEFYMSRTEVTNKSYHDFLNYLAVQEEDSAAWERNFPDTLVWINSETYSYSEPTTNMYFWHPAYDNYPVVGVTYEQCQAYCDWLTRTYNNDPHRKFKKVQFSLPTRKQFIAAAICGEGQRLFSFEGNEIMNKNGPKLNIDNRRAFEASMDIQTCKINFKQQKTYYDDKADYTNKVISYQPNEYGIYNLSGNVQEFIAEYGYVKGGGWRDLLEDASLVKEESYSKEDEKSSQRGFRFVMKIIE